MKINQNIKHPAGFIKHRNANAGYKNKTDKQKINNKKQRIGKEKENVIFNNYSFIKNNDPLRKNTKFDNYQSDNYSNNNYSNNNNIHDEITYKNNYTYHNSDSSDNDKNNYDSDKPLFNNNIIENSNIIKIEKDINVENNTNNPITQNKSIINYVDYIKMIKKKEESLDLNGDGVILNEYNTDSDINYNSNNKNEISTIYNFFLLFCPLAVTSIKNKYCVINADDHKLLFEKKIKNINNLIDITIDNKEKYALERTKKIIQNKLENIRLDILFFTLLSLKDSIINKKKKIQIYIHTINGLVIYVSPTFRVPRNFMLFKKVMLNLITYGQVTDEQGTTLLQIQPYTIKHYVGSSTCVGISNSGFPVDTKKFTEKIKETKTKYSFFLSLSNKYDLTYFINKIKQKENENFSFDYLVRISDLKLSPTIICSKLTHFLDS
ncbi:small subunit rRNA processing factor, putative [Hepatocystis sp. ex Piliocolobus tephrosceles]|nr:small subunit rRNA processing factor, putative [Hepatocystis sp. ex Piliocolobus tephrosceles]